MLSDIEYARQRLLNNVAREIVGEQMMKSFKSSCDIQTYSEDNGELVKAF